MKDKLKILSQEEMEESFLNEKCLKIEHLSLNTITSGKGKNHFFSYFVDGTIVAVLKLRTGQETMMFEGVFNSLNFVSVNSEYKNRGIASKLIDEMFLFLKKRGLGDVTITGYEPEGLLYLPKKIEKSSKEYGITFHHII